MIIGPSATFGKLFSTTKNGSDTFAKNLDHHKIIAIATPINVPSPNPTIVSYTVTFTCFSKSFVVKCVNVLHILLGWLVIKLSIIFAFAKDSQITKNPIKIIN